MANDSVVQTLLKFAVDKQAANQTEKTIADLESALKDYQKTAQAAGKATDKAFDSLAADAKAGKRSIDDVTRSIEAQTAALREQDSINRTRTESFGDLSTGAGALASVGGAFGANLGGASIIGDLAGFAEYVPRLKDSIGNLVGTGGQAVTTLGAMAGAAVALGAVSVLIDKYNQSVENQRRQLVAAIAAQQEIAESVAGGLTSEQARAQIAEAERARQVAQGLLDSAKEAYDAFEQGTADTFGAFGGIVETGLRALDSREQELSNTVSDRAGAVDTYTATIEQLTARLADGSLAANDAAEAERALAEARIATISDDADIQRRLNSAARGTAAAAQERADIITEELAIIQQQVDSYRALGQDTAALERQYTNLGTEQAYLLAQVIPMLQAQEAETQAREDFLRDREEFAEEYNQQIEDELKAEETRLKNIGDVQRRFEEQSLQAVERANQQLADLEQKHADKIIDINRKAVDDEQRVLEQLQQKRIDLARDLAREESDARQELADTDLQQQIDFQRTEVQARKDHLQNLEDIQRRAQEEEFDLSLNRDFQGLFRRRRQTTQELSEAQRSFDKDREARLTAYNQQNEDDLRQFETERRNRQQNYQRQLADAATAAAQERAAIQQQKIAALNDANNAAIRERQLLQQKTQSELALRQQAYTRELQMAALAGDERVALEAEILQALLTRAQETLDALSSGGTSAAASLSGAVSNGGGIPGRALGGAVAAGQTFMVNERGTESFSSGGSTANFPSGLGYFTAARAGTVNTAGQTAANKPGVLLTQNFYGVTNENVMALVRTEVVSVLEKVMS